MEIVVIGAGVGGLTLALSLHQAGLSCRIYEAAPEVKALGVGMNLLPHGMRELTDLGLQERLVALAVTTRKVLFCNRFGRTVLREVHRRTGDKPFGGIEEVASVTELLAILENYQRVAEFDREGLARRGSLV